MAERQISERSLENLKLGSQSRYQGKIRQNFSILLETLEWLKCSGNASAMIDDLVALAKNGGIKNGEMQSSYTHESKRSVGGGSFPRQTSLAESASTAPGVHKRMQALQEQLANAIRERDELAELNHALTIELAERQQIPTPDLEAVRDRILTGLKLGKQAPEYKRTRAVLDGFIGCLLSATNPVAPRAQQINERYDSAAAYAEWRQKNPPRTKPPGYLDRQGPFD